MTNQHELIVDMLVTYQDQQLASMLASQCETLSRELYAKARECTVDSERAEIGRQCGEWSKRAVFWRVASKAKAR